MRDKLGFFIVAIIYMSTLYVLVRPNSKGPGIINNLFSAFTDLVRGVSGQTYDASSGKWKAAS
jgi:hypothetical protein